MPAFESTSAFREAAGFNREYANWNYERYKVYLERAVQSGQISDRLRAQLEDYAQGQINEGFASPEDISAIAQRIMPGLEAAISSRRGRLDDIQQLSNQRTPTGETMGQIFQNTNEQATDITRTGELNQGEIDANYGRNVQGNETTSREVVGNISDSYGSAARGVNDSFGGMRRASGDATGRMVNRIGSGYSGLRDSSARTYNGLDSANRDVTGGLLRSGDEAFGEVAGARGRTYAGAREDTAGTITGLEGNARSTANDLTSRFGSAYGGLNTEAGRTFDEQGAGATDTFDSSIADAQSLAPTGQAQQARTERSFAPNIAAAKARLRRRGINADDAQAQQVIGEIERDRARAADDSAAQFGERSVDRVNELRMGRQSALERIGNNRLNTRIGLTGEELGAYERTQNTLRDAMQRLGMEGLSRRTDLNLSELSDTERQRLNQELMRQGLNLGQLERQMNIAQQRQQGEERLTENEISGTNRAEEAGINRDINLGTGQSDRAVQIGLRQGEDYRNELLRRFGNDQTSDSTRTQATIGNNDQGYTRTQDWRTNSNNANLLNRALQTQDFETAAALLREQNGEDITALNLRDMAAQRGNDWIMNNYARRDAGAANIGNLYAREGQRETTAANLARGFGGDAERNYARTYEQEAGKGGWGTRLIVGGVTAGLNAVAPGLGTAVGGIAGGALNGTSAAGGGRVQTAGSQQQGAQGQNGANSYNFGWQMPTYQRPQNRAINFGNGYEQLYAGG